MVREQECQTFRLQDSMCSFFTRSPGPRELRAQPKPRNATPPLRGDGHASLNAQCERSRSWKCWKRKIRASHHAKQIKHLDKKIEPSGLSKIFFSMGNAVLLHMHRIFNAPPPQVFKSFKTFSVLVLNLIHSFIHTSSWKQSLSYMLFLLFFPHSSFLYLA